MTVAKNTQQLLKKKLTSYSVVVNTDFQHDRF